MFAADGATVVYNPLKDKKTNTQYLHLCQQVSDTGGTLTPTCVTAGTLNMQLISFCLLSFRMFCLL